MIVDTSALLAVLLNEADAARFATALADADVCRISAANFVEAAIVADSQARASSRPQLDAFLRRAAIAIEPVTADQAHIARQAYFDYGKGRHPAGLNFGDCFAYALSKTTGEPLLFKGADFAKTDVTAA
jgi:ribonuclease VapC